MTKIKLKYLLTLAILVIKISVISQNVTHIYTTYDGWWSSGVGNINTKNVDASSILLAFTLEGKTYSTGVDDALLNTKLGAGNYTPTIFEAFQILNIGAGASGAYVGIPYKYEGVEQLGGGTKTGYNVLPNPASYYLTDGTHGLELSTAIFNVPSQVNSEFHINSITADEIGSTTNPDIIITQMGAIGASDTYKFVDASGNTVGNTVTISYTNISSVGHTIWAFFNMVNLTYSSPQPGGTTPANNTREIRLRTLDLSDFGLNASNIGQIKKLVQINSGTSDPAFIAYNKSSINLTTADLEVSKTVNKTNPVLINDDVTFTVTVSNLGPNDATGVKANDKLPSGYTFTSAATSSGTTYNSSTGLWDIGSLANGASVTLTLNAKVNDAGTLLNVATISETQQHDPVALNNSASAFTVLAPNYWLGTTNTEWDIASNWNRGFVPFAGQPIVFATAANNTTPAANNLAVPANTEKIIGDLTNLSDKALLIPANASVKVQGVVSGSESNPDRIVIQAASDNTTPNGTFIVDCASNSANTIQATVQLRAKGYKSDEVQTWIDNIVGSPTFGQTFSSSYKWQYFGVPVASVVANPTFAGSYLRAYDEAKNATDRYYDKWHDLHNASVLTAFKGYSVTQIAPTIHHIKGALQFCDKQITLTRMAPQVTGATGIENNIRYGLGQNIFGNSFTAAIPINQIVFPNDVEKTVYLYNTGSFAEWGGGSSAREASTAGSYIAVPSDVAPELYYGKIPSMQGFLLRHIGAIDSNISMTLPYASVAKNDRPQTAPRQALSHIEIELTSASTIDRLWLFSVPGTSLGFDNGWDGRKFFGTPTAFIYSPTPNGNLQVNTTNNLLGTNIAFVANNDTEYTLKITKTNLDDQYGQLYLHDFAEQKSVMLENNITTYQFNDKKAGISQLRFAISDNANGLAQNADNWANAYVHNNTLYATNKSTFNCTLQIRTITGQLLYSKNLAAMSLFNDNLKLPQGTYLITMHSEISNISTKIIIN